MRRREFVKTMTAAGAGLLLPGLGLAAQEMNPDETVKRVLVMFKCHFDAGFIDTQYNVVHQRTSNQYFPQAIEVARAANAAGKRRYVWTTGSWLLFEYLEQASAADRKTMEEAIGRGDIAWHALPFTWQTEMLSPSMIEGSVALARFARQAIRHGDDGREDDRCAGAHAWIDCAAREAGCDVSGDWREWRIDGRQSCRRYFCGRIRAARAWR